MIFNSLILSICCCVCVFFFFKQKTAYEMRISDWSSDVCSSDLSDGVQADRPVRAMRGVEAAAEEAGGDHSRLCQSLRRWIMRRMRSRSALKIGRASCRERVCQ